MDSLCDDGVDGGYYAIKGFLYQFDKTIIEILDRPDENIAVEYLQDINSLDYVIQCKYKETQDYANSKIRKPILQLIDIHAKYPEMDIILYCYFKDKNAQKWKISLNELDDILYSKKKDYTKDYTCEVKKTFIEKLTIEFSCDYAIQVEEVTEKIQRQLQCSREEALIYHGVFKSELLNKAISKDADLRITNFSSLKGLKKDTSGTIFTAAYEDMLGLENYIKFIKKQYFTFLSGNINHFERLFIIELDNAVVTTDLLHLVLGISRKYYRTYRGGLKSPPPYICLIGDNNLQIEAKRKLIDQNVCFTDGTCFNGDNFRINKLTQKSTMANGLSLRLISEENLLALQAVGNFDEVYCLTCSENKSFDVYGKLSNISNCNYIQLSSFNAIKKLFE